jgi:putative heme-binding domain-containing protein
VQEGHRAVSPKMVEKVLNSKTPEARAAAVRVVANEWDRLPGGMAVLKHAVADDNPRVRLEAVRALSYVPTLEAAELAASITSKPMDYYLDYTLEHTLRALEDKWKAPFEKGEFAGTNSPAHGFVAIVARGRPELVPAMRSLKTLIQNPGIEGKAREDALQTVARAKGRANAGREVYERVCVACHKIGEMGIDFGPNLSDVGKRLKREEIAESILYPNLKVDPKYVTVNITTKDGEELTGVMLSEDETAVNLKLGAGVVQKVAKDNIAKRETTKVSNMPEGLAESIQAEFVDLIEYLAAQKADVAAAKAN